MLVEKYVLNVLEMLSEQITRDLVKIQRQKYE